MNGYSVNIKMKSNGASANGCEIAKILRLLADKVDWNDNFDGTLRDINGNIIGQAKIVIKIKSNTL